MALATESIQAPCFATRGSGPGRCLQAGPVAEARGSRVAPELLRHVLQVVRLRGVLLGQRQFLHDLLGERGPCDHAHGLSRCRDAGRACVHDEGAFFQADLLARMHGH